MTNKEATRLKLTHLRKAKDRTDFRAGQDITKWDLVIEEDETAEFLVT